MPLSGTYRGWSVLVPGEPYGGSRLLRALELLQSAPVEVLQEEGESRTAWLAEALGYAVAPQEVGLDSYLAALPQLPLVVPAPGPRRTRRRSASLPSSASNSGSQPSASSHFSGGGRDRDGGERDPISRVSVRRAGLTRGLLPGPRARRRWNGEWGHILGDANRVGASRHDRSGTREFRRTAAHFLPSPRPSRGGWTEVIRWSARSPRHAYTWRRTRCVRGWSWRA